MDYIWNLFLKLRFFTILPLSVFIFFAQSYNLTKVKINMIMKKLYNQSSMASSKS